MKEDDSKGFWIYETEIINLIKICNSRNKPLMKRLIDAYEHLEQKTFDKKIIK